jgi:copper chaperone CopZ
MSTLSDSRPVITTYEVPGISCQHCVNALTHEIGQVCGVQHVEVDVERQQVTVTSAHPLDRVVVAAAVDEAGYRLGS